VKVRNVMTHDVVTCRPEETLGALAGKMWDGDCGVVPVVDDQNRPIGLITDRDAFIAAATRNQRPSEIRVQDAMHPASLVTVSPDDDVRTALQRMASSQVRRLPVVDERGTLVGIMTLSDPILHASRVGGGEHQAEIVRTLEAICVPRQQNGRAQASA